MNKNEAFVKRWEIRRSKGMVRYIALWGLLYYGLTFFLIWTFLVPFVDSNFTFDFVYKDTFSTRIIAFTIVFSLFGLLLGYLQWWQNERKYNDNRC